MNRSVLTFLGVVVLAATLLALWPHCVRASTHGGLGEWPSPGVGVFLQLMVGRHELDIEHLPASYSFDYRGPADGEGSMIKVQALDLDQAVAGSGTYGAAADMHVKLMRGYESLSRVEWRLCVHEKDVAWVDVLRPVILQREPIGELHPILISKDSSWKLQWRQSADLVCLSIAAVEGLRVEAEPVRVSAQQIPFVGDGQLLIARVPIDLLPAHAGGATRTIVQMRCRPDGWLFQIRLE